MLRALFDAQLARFRAAPEQATAYVGAVADTEPARHAAMTVVANTLMAYDDCVTKR